ncbi:hypothetical protein IWW39_005750 [Coemansia spiralis]|uniref:Uncharacterized protein n=1 Tax=Coemansia spiralis TaxID=417178 RepID=A0A9W8GGY5_9FUNG|nr:hypothetical protein IWW39_005750 [Coemansia spiralis]
MSNLSTFQLLPLPVVECIVRYVIHDTSLDTEWTILAGGRLKAWLKPLLWVSSSLRYTSLPFYCHIFTLDFASNVPRGLKDLCSFTDYTDIGFPTYFRLAKCLAITVNEQDIHSGEALKKLSLVPYNGCSVSKARKLWFLIALDCSKDNGGLGPPTVKTNIAAFVQRVRQMAPLASEAQINYYPLSDASRPSRYFGDLALQIFQLASHINYYYDFETEVPIQLELDNICNLVSMTLMIDGYSCPLIHLVRQNAPTLQWQSLLCENVIDAAGLILCPDGSYVVYPHLRYLSLSDETDDYVPERVTFKRVVPFPNLQHIILTGCYPFGDDVLFRANSATLESVHLLVSDLFVSVVTDYNVFTPTSHQKLHQVMISHPIDEMPSQFETPAEALQFMLSIGPGATVRKIEGDHSGSDLVPALLSSLNYNTIRVLFVSYLSLELLELIALIETLPALLTLETLLPILGSITSLADIDKLPAYVLSTYAPVDRHFHFRNWRPCPSDYPVESVKCVLLLAFVYPHVVYSDSQQRAIKEFMDELDTVMASAAFKPYAQHLQYFLENGLIDSASSWFI